MKFLVSLLLLGLATTSTLRAAESAGADTTLRIAAAAAKDHIGSRAVVTGTVAEVHKAEKLVRLNFEKPFPKQPFTAIVFADKTNRFPDLDSFKGKRVEVSGKIIEYRDRPEIVLTNAAQLKVIEGKAGGGEKK